MPPSLETLQQVPYHHEMIFVQGGSFLMGSDDKEAYIMENPVHHITLSDFYIAKYPVTQALWKEMMGNNPSYFMGDSRPVENVSWNDSQAFIQKLNKATGHSYRLPTEAEWEYAARGGIKGNGYRNEQNACSYAGSDNIDDVAWYLRNSQDETQWVGLKNPNELGLYDMSGNVFEWCQDEWRGGDDTVPDYDSGWSGQKKVAYRLNRGGSWSNAPQACHRSFRNIWQEDSRNNALGFRLAASSYI